jgi:predicted CopG family antitoxin
MVGIVKGIKMTKGLQKGKGNLKFIAIRPEVYNKLIELGSMRDSFNDVITEIMKKAGIESIGPDYEELSDKQ